MSKHIHTDKAPAAIGPYVQATETEQLVFVSGQLGIDMSTGEMPEDVSEQARCSMANLGAILAEAGLKPENVLKTTIFLTDMAYFADVNKVYADFFGEHYPARSCIAVCALPKGAKVEVECIAQK